MLTSETQRPADVTEPSVASTRDSDHLRELYDRYAEDLFRTAYRLLGSRADAEDAVQDFFVGLPEAVRGYQGRGALGAWMRAVVVRIALQRLRRSSRRKEVPLDGRAEPLADRSTEASLGAIDLQRALNALPETLRSVLVLKELEGYTHEEIGQMLGIRTGTSKIRLHRAREMLRNLLRSAP